MQLVYLVVAMSIVTYIPRLAPFVLLGDVRLPRPVKRFMDFIPYAALGALIFPGVLGSTGADSQGAAAAGGMLALLLAFAGINLMLVVAGGIAGAVIVNMLL